MQIPFVGFQPIRTSEHMAAAGRNNSSHYWMYSVCVDSAAQSYHSVTFLFELVIKWLILIFWLSVVWWVLYKYMNYEDKGGRGLHKTCTSPCCYWIYKPHHQFCIHIIWGPLWIRFMRHKTQQSEKCSETRGVQFCNHYFLVWFYWTWKKKSQIPISVWYDIGI